MSGPEVQSPPAIVKSADTTPGTAASSRSAIQMNGIGKRYRLGDSRRMNDSLGDEMAGWFSRWRRRGQDKDGDSLFWALRGIDLEVMRGDTVGIIGRNGAGKSTLLKILSRITTPTTGTMRYMGRLASLLEVGTGFHRELTGRENIFLNGSILGMRRREIEQQFDAIVEFAGTEKFLDTPVKFYSSGMYVRLAFAVAAHLRTDILVVDEVLAVGDAQFQKKCLGKMQDVAGDGRTVLFVSHNMATVQRLCASCIYLRDGQLVTSGETVQVIQEYLKSGINLGACADRGPDPSFPMRLRTAAVVDEEGEILHQVERSQKAFLSVRYDINEPVKDVHVVCHITDMQNNIIVSTGDCDMGRDVSAVRSPGAYEGRFQIPSHTLNDGSYSVTVALGIPYRTVYDREASCADFQVVDLRREEGPTYAQRRPGFLAIDIPWEVVRVEE
ncbi:MAG: ABC transporter ATP-binding protein [Sumerlaeia bacterium]